jgi:hypothetical protein
MKESEVEEMKQKEEHRYRGKIENKYTCPDMVLSRLRKEEAEERKEEY